MCISQHENISLSCCCVLALLQLNFSRLKSHPKVETKRVESAVGTNRVAVTTSSANQQLAQKQISALQRARVDDGHIDLLIVTLAPPSKANRYALRLGLAAQTTGVSNNNWMIPTGRSQPSRIAIHSFQVTRITDAFSFDEMI